MPTTIVAYSQESIDLLQNVNYTISKSHFNYLCIIVEGDSSLFVRI